MKQIHLAVLILLFAPDLHSKDLRLSISFANEFFIRASFTNESQENKTILRPLDGASAGKFQPHYIFTVEDSKGRKLPHVVHDFNAGLWADLDWPEDYIITLGPGETKDVKIACSQIVSAEGRIKISLRYEYTKEEAEPQKGIQYPAEAWEGSIKSNSISLDIQK